jgi:hypothetical protein
MADRPSYKLTLFDREGPDAGLRIQAFFRAMAAGGISFPMWLALGALWGLPPLARIAFTIGASLATWYLVFKLTMKMMDTTGQAVRVVMEGGSSTPYTEQHSFEQSLVMRGRLPEALESLEAKIADPLSTVDVRIRAAELYAREAKRPDRAAELLKEAIRHPQCTPGEEIYSSFRLADLLSIHLAQPGKALVVLSRIADRYKGTPTGDRARESIRVMKSGGPVDLYAAAAAEPDPLTHRPTEPPSAV